VPNSQEDHKMMESQHLGGHVTVDGEGGSCNGACSKTVLVRQVIGRFQAIEGSLRSCAA